MGTSNPIACFVILSISAMHWRVSEIQVAACQTLKKPLKIPYSNIYIEIGPILTELSLLGFGGCFFPFHPTSCNSDLKFTKQA